MIYAEIVVLVERQWLKQKVNNNLKNKVAIGCLIIFGYIFVIFCLAIILEIIYTIL